MTANPSQSEAEAIAGLMLLMKGELAAGLDRYRAGFGIEHVHRLPIGLHLQLLANAGRRDEADALRSLAVRKGANVAVRHLVMQVPAEEAAAEYETLFERGVANARMVGEYFVLLSRLGRADELRRWLAPKLLFRTVQLDPAFAAEVEAALLAREAAGVEKAPLAIQGMRRIVELHRDHDPALRRLFAMLTREMEGYFAAWAASPHPLARRMPTALRLSGWGLVARESGIVARHIHPKGWATGVYYPTSVSAGGGALCIGGEAEGDSEANGWFETRVQPRAGLLVLMPSFYTHWTTPLEGGGLRTSVAFDVRGLGADEAAELPGVDAAGVPV